MLPRVRFNIGDTVQLSRDRVGIIKYVGAVRNKYGEWYGIELKNSKNGGKNNGSIGGIFYFQTQRNYKNGMFVRLHQILYLVKRNQKNHKIKVIRKKSKKIKKRNYIKSMKQSMNIHNVRKTDKDFFLMLIPETAEYKQSLVQKIPKDVLKYNILCPYFYSFEKFQLRTVCSEFNDIFVETQNILLSSIESDITYWTNHTFSKYYKISPNYFSYLDLRHNKLSYLTKQQQIALKYFVIFNRNIENLLTDVYNKKNAECQQEKRKMIKPQMQNDKNITKMTRISFFNSSVDTCYANIDWMSDILQFHCFHAPLVHNINISCLKILDLNYIGLNDECLLKLSQALLARNTALNELEYLLLLNNNISDKYIDILFKGIEKSLPHLLHLNFRRCNLGDLSCCIILNFYVKNMNENMPSTINHLDLELNSKITKIGSDKINKIFQINNGKLIKNNLVIHYGANKKRYCWQCRTLYEQ